MLRELGVSVVPTCAALDTQPDGRAVLVVVERVARGGVHSDQEIGDWVRDARRLATLEHPNVARTRDVVIRGQEVFVVSEYLDGVRWSEVAATPGQASLEVALRILVDVLSGLSAVHNLRDAKREPLKLVHGELTPDCVILGMDGVGRIVGTSRVRSSSARPARDGSAYLAPEVLLADETADARADVYSVGVMLWEALSGRPMFPTSQPSAIVTHILSGKVSRATVPKDSPWAAPLVDVAARALAADPEKRFSSAAALAAELRRIAGPKLAAPVRVAAFVRAAFGDGVQARRAALERGEVGERGLEVESLPDSVEIQVEFSTTSISSAPTPVPPSPGHPAPPPVAIPPAPRTPALSPPGVPPPFRPRMPTMAGVAPPASLEGTSAGQGTQVVVPSSDRPPRPMIAPPTPLVAFEVPSAAKIPADVARTVEAHPTSAVAPVAPFVPTPPPTPAPSFVASIDEPMVPLRPRRGMVAVLAGVIFFAIVAFAWWLLSRGSSPALRAEPTTGTSGTSVAVPSTSTPTPTPTSTPTPTPTSTSTSTPTSAAPPQPPPALSPPPVFTPQPAPPPTSKRKYEPEGI